MDTWVLLVKSSDEKAGTMVYLTTKNRKLEILKHICGRGLAANLARLQSCLRRSVTCTSSNGSSKREGANFKVMWCVVPDDSDTKVDVVDAAADGYTVVTPTSVAGTEDPVIMKTTSVWNQSAITTFLRERKQYEGKVIEQCRVTGEVQAAVTRSICSTLEPTVLEHVAHYRLKQGAASVSDDMLVAEMKWKVGTMVNGRVPNFTQLFERELKMDLSEVDVDARIAAYFMKFDQLVADNGLARRPLGSDCPPATAEQKGEVTRTLRERRDRLPKRVKRITTDDAPPFCPDTGSDANIIGRPVLEELRDLVHDLPVERVEPPLQVVAAGGDMLLCREKLQVDLQIVTAAGPLSLTNIECLVLNALEEGLLLGTTMLQSIGVDLDGVFEQLAQQHIDAAEAEAEDVPSSHVEVLGTAEDDEVETVLHRLVDEAIEAWFDADRSDELRRIVIDYADVFRLRLDYDETANDEPLEVRLEAGAQPYRSGMRRYPEALRQFLWDYVRELESVGHVVRNNQSRLSCPALPVAKRGSGEFLITIDYCPVSRMTLPPAGAAPNLAVVVESVRGAYGPAFLISTRGFGRYGCTPTARRCSVSSRRMVSSLLHELPGVLAIQKSISKHR
ncbi:unnamed protein product [Phytophthora fragariaefolia]|uniref:Unnamed protein product n=1 Tax=Phytophthora fragariaefolia TaxID=1490495 RepID=A0A9W6XGJ1_9STRA|nr:unnamed protein product [Phytophthora fragariaefolia]